MITTSGRFRQKLFNSVKDIINSVLILGSVLVLISLAGGAINLLLSILPSGPITLLDVAQNIATPDFVILYGGILLSITLFAIVAAERRLGREWRGAKQLIKILRGDDSPDQQLKQLNRLTDARIIVNELCRNESLTSSERLAANQSGILRAAGSFLGALTSVPAIRHSLEGLRPAAGILYDQVRRHTPRLTGLGDIVIRLALLGTFIGLIAALTIASANVGLTQASEEAQSDQMRQFIEQLLASAATKFWISAIGIACALVLRVWQVRLDQELTKLAREVGLAFDNAAAKPSVVRTWCPQSGMAR